MRPEAIYVGNNRVLARTRRRLKMFLDASDVSISPHIILDGTWEEWTTQVIVEFLRPGMTVVEVGANMGYYTLIAAQCVGPSGKVFAFEPDPILHRMLRDNVEINGFRDRVVVEAFALADHTGVARFYATNRHRGNGSLVENLEQLGKGADEISAFDVAVTTLDAYGIAAADLIKVDVEGSEAAVFRGAAAFLSRSAKLRAVIEFCPEFFRKAGEDPRAFLEGMSRSNFSIERIDARRRQPRATTIDELLATEISDIVLSRSAKPGKTEPSLV